MINRFFVAFALLHCLVPAISVIYFDAPSLWLAGNLLFVVAAYLTIDSDRSTLAVLGLCLLSAVTFMLSAMLGASYYMQGEGFNDQFFYHLDTNTLIIAARSYSGVFYPALAGLLVALLAPALVYRYHLSPRRNGWAITILWVIAVIAHYPLHSYSGYRAELTQYREQILGQAETPITPSEAPETAANPKFPDSTEEHSPIEILQSQPASTTPTLVESANMNDQPAGTGQAPLTVPDKPVGKNIILIYAESLEQIYFDEAIFAGLLPNIRELAPGAHQFTNMVQERGTSWTIAGIVASQCGFPLVINTHIATNSTIASVERPYADRVCLADILSEQGYETVFYGGAPLWFGGKGNFLRTHGYQRIYGDEELLPLLNDPQYRTGWGLYDDSLFDLAIDELTQLEARDRPYFLTVLTLDTHHPDGDPSASCSRLPGDRDSMSNAIYCSDQLISRFIRRSMDIVDMDDTIIVLFADHLSLRNALWKKLIEHRKKRRLTFMIFDQQPGSSSNIRANHFDVAPTVLEAAGIPGPHHLGRGRSLLSVTGRPVATSLNQDEHDDPALISSNASIKTHGAEISAAELRLTIGDLELTANRRGAKFTSGMYIVVFNEEGRVTDTVFSDDYDQVLKNLEGTFVVGISVFDNRRETASWFYGRISSNPGGLRQGPLNRNIHISVDEIIAAMQPASAG